MIPKQDVHPGTLKEAREHLMRSAQLVEEAAVLSTLKQDDKKIVSLLYVLVEVVEALTDRLLAKYE